ncbi:MAG: hypothetical protein NUW09_02545 [Deltaproteobacteria bacterium]|nr:hypothetical protein [Deltaproteobacteria bacterium]
MPQMIWSTQSGYLTNGKLNKEFQEQSQPLQRFRQFTSIKNALGKNSGQTVNWLQVSNVANYGGIVAETNTAHETNLTLTWGTLTVNEYINSIPFTFAIETLSEFDIKEIIKTSLLHDSVKCIDGEIERQFNATPLRYVGTATAGYVLTTNGTATATNTSVLNSYHVRKMRLELEKRNVPTWKGEYVCIASLEAMEGLEGALESVYQYTESGADKILAGEVGKLHGVRFVKDGFASRYTYDSTARTATAKSWGTANSLDAYMFGQPTVAEALTVPEEIRMKITTDYGRSKGLAWYGMFGWKIMWATAADARIIKWDSAG